MHNYTTAALRTHPDDQLAVLRAGHEVALVRAPVQAHHLGVVPLQTLPYLDVELVYRGNTGDVCYLLQGFVLITSR